VGAVRPSLRILNLPNLQIGDIVECLGKKWHYVGDDLILSVVDIGRHCFNRDWKKSNANEFEGSDIQKYLQNWLREQMSKKESLKEDSENRKMSDGPLPMEPDKSLKKENKMNLEEFRKNRKERLKKLSEEINLPDIDSQPIHGEMDASQFDGVKQSKEREKKVKDSFKEKNKETREFIKKQDKDTDAAKDEKAEDRLMLDESLFREDGAESEKNNSTLENMKIKNLKEDRNSYDKLMQAWTKWVWSVD
jgi:hypothetical protein